MKRNVRRQAVRTILVLAVAWLGCSAEGDPGSVGRRGGSGAASASDPFGNAAAGSGGGATFDNTSTSGGVTTPPATMTNGTLGDDDVCDADNYAAEPKRLDLYMMVDDSGSMVPWWPGTLQSINEFFADPRSDGMGVGVQFFGSDCNAGTYATPRVAISPLPGSLTALQAAFPLIPIEGTATVPAMQGAIMHASDWANQHADAKTVVLLVTDGLPDDCNSTVQGVVDAIAAGLNGTPSIQTFVIGIGFGLDALNMFAAAGGTGQAILVDPAAAGSLLTALNEIRGAALPCDYKLPNNTGTAPQLDKVNLRYTDPTGATTTIGYVSSAADCDATQGGWYFNDAKDRLLACDLSCNQLKGVGGEVSVVVGCPRVEIVPQ